MAAQELPSCVFRNLSKALRLLASMLTQGRTQKSIGPCWGRPLALVGGLFFVFLPLPMLSLPRLAMRGAILEVFIRHITAEFAAIQSAPMSFVTAILLMGGAFWWLSSWYSRREVASLRSERDLARSQRDEYQSKLGGKTPDDAQAELTELKQRVRLTIGDHWQPLSEADINRLSARVSQLDRDSVSIFFQNRLGEELARSFEVAFTRAGWTVQIAQSTGFPDGISTGRGSDRALTLKAAIEASTRFTMVRSLGVDENWLAPPFIAVGITAP